MVNFAQPSFLSYSLFEFSSPSARRHCRMQPHLVERERPSRRLRPSSETIYIVRICRNTATIISVPFSDYAHTIRNDFQRVRKTRSMLAGIQEFLIKEMELVDASRQEIWGVNKVDAAHENLAFLYSADRQPKRRWGVGIWSLLFGFDIATCVALILPY